MSAFLRSLFLLPACTLALGGCGLFPEVAENEYVGKSAAQLYQAGHSYGQGRNFVKAIEAFGFLESSYPFDPYAQQGMLEMAYAHFWRDEYDLAIAVLDRFIEQNPVHSHIAYAYYLRGTTYLNYGKGLVHYVLPYIRHDKDPTPWKTAFENFSWIVENAPRSPYAKDAEYRAGFLRNVLARHELHVMDFYLRRKAYVAVVNRARHALVRYHGSPAMADILWYQEQGYLHLAIPELADAAHRVRKANFPDYQKPRHLIEEESTWLGEGIEHLDEFVDYTARTIGFDIGDFEHEDFSEHYQTVVLPLPETGEYQPGLRSEKIVVSQVPEGFTPVEHSIQKNLWDYIWALVTLEQNVFDELRLPLYFEGKDQAEPPAPDAVEPAPTATSSP